MFEACVLPGYSHKTMDGLKFLYCWVWGRGEEEDRIQVREGKSKHKPELLPKLSCDQS
jgi:hypothetical protein